MSIIAEGKVVALLTMILAYALFHYYAQIFKGELKSRTLPPVDAISEAVGRCAEMGRPLVYTVGISGTISGGAGAAILAGTALLGHTAKMVAEAGTPLKFFTATVDAYPLIEETIKQAYTSAGVPEAYDPESIELIANQSSLVSRYLGWIQREKPASALMIGYLAYEAVVLAEGGNVIGAMQISGTTNQYQIPFLVASTDYCLIMEELYAASAQIQGDRFALGALKGEDMLKFVVLAVMGVGMLIAFTGATFLVQLLGR